MASPRPSSSGQPSSGQRPSVGQIERATNGFVAALFLGAAVLLVVAAVYLFRELRDRQQAREAEIERLLGARMPPSAPMLSPTA